MGLFKRSVAEPGQSSDEAGASQSQMPVASKKSIFDFLIVNRTRVPEATLAVWRNLPSEIRQDPSMINFQREAERWKGEDWETKTFAEI